MPSGKREVARAETERLKSQAKQKREMLERMREQQNALATMGDVRGAPALGCLAPGLAAVPLVSSQCSLQRGTCGDTGPLITARCGSTRRLTVPVTA